MQWMNMNNDPGKDIQIGSDADHSVLVTGSQNVIIQAEQVMLQAAQQAAAAQRDPARMLRVLALLAAPVYNPRSPDQSPTPLDLRQEWHVLADGVRRSGAPILLARLIPPTLDALRYALSPRAMGAGRPSPTSCTSAAMPGGRGWSWRTSWTRCIPPPPPKSCRL